MNTFVTISVYDADVDRQRLDQLLDAAVAEINRVESFASDYSDTTEVGRVNRRAGTGPVRISGELAALLQGSIRFGEMSQGAFDVTIGPLVKEWDFMAEPPRVPTAMTVQRLLSLVDYSRIQFGEVTVLLPRRGMRLDLGGIAKGYAVDRAARVLREGGLKNFIVDIGGNLGVFWHGTSMVDSTAVLIEVRHPRKEGDFLGSFRAGTAGIATSGDYQRSFISDGIRYHHILDPKTGFPVRGVVSVTAIASDAMTADVMSTIVFVLGREKGMLFVERTENVEAIIVHEKEGELQIDLSSGLAGKVWPTAQ
jgi:thiamine biosynthesis lipoprotein